MKPGRPAARGGDECYAPGVPPEAKKLAALLEAVLSELADVPLGELVVLGVVAGALGQLGDLAESMIKRSAGIKDSGNLIPGHGGLLDRIDALLIVSPVVYLYAVSWR